MDTGVVGWSSCSCDSLRTTSSPTFVTRSREAVMTLWCGASSQPAYVDRIRPMMGFGRWLTSELTRPMMTSWLSSSGGVGPAYGLSADWFEPCRAEPFPGLLRCEALENQLVVEHGAGARREFEAAFNRQCRLLVLVRGYTLDTFERGDRSPRRTAQLAHLWTK